MPVGVGFVVGEDARQHHRGLLPLCEPFVDVTSSPSPTAPLVGEGGGERVDSIMLVACSKDQETEARKHQFIS